MHVSASLLTNWECWMVDIRQHRKYNLSQSNESSGFMTLRNEIKKTDDYNYAQRLLIPFFLARILCHRWPVSYLSPILHWRKILCTSAVEYDLRLKRQFLSDLYINPTAYMCLQEWLLGVTKRLLNILSIKKWHIWWINPQIYQRWQRYLRNAHLFTPTGILFYTFGKTGWVVLLGFLLLTWYD